MKLDVKQVGLTEARATALSLAANTFRMVTKHTYFLTMISVTCQQMEINGVIPHRLCEP